MTNDQPFDNPYDGMPAVKIAEEMARIAAEVAALSEAKTTAQKKLDSIRKFALPDAMEREGIHNMTVTGIGRFALRADVYAQLSSANKDVAFDWLRGTGHGCIIKDSVHAGTLKSLMKTLIRDGKALPPEDLIRITPYSIAVLTRTAADAPS